MKEIIKSVDELTAYAQEKLELNARIYIIKPTA